MSVSFPPCTFQQSDPCPHFGVAFESNCRFHHRFRLQDPAYKSRSLSEPLDVIRARQKAYAVYRSAITNQRRIERERLYGLAIEHIPSALIELLKAYSPGCDPLLRPEDLPRWELVSFQNSMLQERLSAILEDREVEAPAVEQGRLYSAFTEHFWSRNLISQLLVKALARRIQAGARWNGRRATDNHQKRIWYEVARAAYHLIQRIREAWHLTWRNETAVFCD